MQRRRRLRQRRQIGGFGDREFVHRFVEIDQRCGRDAVGAEAEIDFVEIEFEDAVLGIGALDAHRQQGFLDLAGERHLVGQKEVLRDLLGDRRGALRTPVGAEILRIQHGGARHAGEVDAAMLVEVLVLGGQERVDDQLRHRLDRQIEPALLGVFAEQRAVGRMDARHHRRLVILKLRVVRQVLGEMPDRARDAGDADQEHDGSGGEQETQKPDQQAHYRSSVSTLCADSCGVCPNTAIPSHEPPLRGRTIKGPADNIARFRRPAVLFYSVVAVAKLGLGLPDGRFSLSSCGSARSIFTCPPAVWRRKRQSPGPSIRPSWFRQFSDTRCSRSPLFET